MSSSIVSPFPVFNDLDGTPLEAGYIYIGTANLNPEVSPISVFWDAARTVPAAQPIRTIGGYASRNGSPGNLYVNSDTYSITVRNRNQVFVFAAFNQSDAPTAVFNVAQQVITATAQQVTFTLTTFTYLPGTDTLEVYRNGLHLTVNVDYIESNSSTVTLTTPAAAEDEFMFRGGTVITGNQTPGSNVSFLQAGTGAITRNMQDKARESVSVLDFGAVGDGVADDTAAIQAAINASTGKQLVLPSGNYKISGTLVVMAGIYIVGQGQVEIVQSVANTTALRVGDGTLANRPGDILIENLTFTTSVASNWTSAYVIDLNCSYFVELKGLDIYGFTGASPRFFGGIRIFKSMRVKAERCFVRGLISGGNCVYTLGETGSANHCSDITLESCYFDSFSGNGVYFDDYTLGTFLYNQVMVSSTGTSLITYDIASPENSNHVVYGFNAEGTGTVDGIVINSGRTIQIQNAWFSAGVGKNAISVGVAGIGVQLQGIWTTEGRWNISGKAVRISDCYIGSLSGDSAYALTINGTSGNAEIVDVCNTTIDQFTLGGINLVNAPNRVSIVGVRFQDITGISISGAAYAGGLGPIVEGVSSNAQNLSGFIKPATSSILFEYGREVFQVTGATPIQNITLQHPGRRLYLQAGTGGFSFTSGGNIQYNTASVSAFDLVELVCVGDAWYEIGK